MFGDQPDVANNEGSLSTHSVSGPNKEVVSRDLFFHQGVGLPDDERSIVELVRKDFLSGRA